jgi:tRNA (guanine-N7-)-methyltransferase
LSRRKLLHFAEMARMPRVWEHPPNTAWTWRERLQNPEVLSIPPSQNQEPPLILELGCGTGLWTVGVGSKKPDHLWLGADIKGARMWHGAKLIEALGLNNAGFLRTRLEDIEMYFGEGEISEIWITFPDPQPRESREKKRLTSPAFLKRYRKVLQDGGYLHLKTDNTALFEYTLEAWKDNGLTLERCIRDVHHPDERTQRNAYEQETLSVLTTYESRYMAQGLPIHYVRARWT